MKKSVAAALFVVFGILASGCVQVSVKNDAAAPTPVAGAEPKKETAPAPVKEVPSALPPKPVRQRPEPSAPLDLTKVTNESGEAPPQLPSPSTGGSG